ncbi:MAG: SIS domain-containing protein [Clostridia bacterium]|nr:SIS domain-containing protein [Clostridia bacterium]
MSLTLGEIRGQYAALKKTIQLLDEKHAALKEMIRNERPSSIVFTGCGSSYSLSCAFRTIASLRTDIPVYAVAAGDLWLNCVRYRRMLEGALVIAVSRSGETSELVNACTAIRDADVGTRFLSVVCAENTPQEALSDFTLCMPWAFDASVCQTRCVSNMFAMGAMIIGCLFDDPTIREGMAKMAACGPDYLERIEPIAKDLAAKAWDHGVVLADGEIDGIAEEAALTFKEICQQNSNYYHVLDVRHGPMVMIGAKTLVVAAVKSPVCKYEAQLIQDLVATGATVVCYAAQAIDIQGALCVPLGEEVGSVAFGLGLVALCQLTTYYKSLIVGCDPDRPDGLDPWIRIV